MTREEAIQVLQAALTSPFIYGEYADAIDMAIEALSQPIVAKHFDIQSGYIYCSPQDAENVEVVVRCKDCRYRKKVGTSYYCDLDGFSVQDANFCSWAERREP